MNQIAPIEISKAMLAFCEAVAGSEEFQTARRNFSAFQANPAVREKYETLNAFVERLSAEHARTGQHASPEEEAAMDEAARALFSDPGSRELKLARGFAQQIGGRIEQSLIRMIESGSLLDPSHHAHDASCKCCQH